MGQETSCSVFHFACEKKKKKFFFVQISVFVRGQKKSSELIQLLLDKTMAHSELPIRQTTRQTDQRNAKQFSSTAIDATPAAIL